MSRLLQSLVNKSVCLTYGNGTPTDFGARRVWAGPCGGAGTSWVVDAASSTVAAASEALFEQPGPRKSGNIQSGVRVVFLISSAHLHVRSMGVPRACR